MMAYTGARGAIDIVPQWSRSKEKPVKRKHKPGKHRMRASDNNLFKKENKDDTR